MAISNTLKNTISALIEEDKFYTLEPMLEALGEEGHEISYIMPKNTTHNILCVKIDDVIICNTKLSEAFTFVTREYKSSSCDKIRTGDCWEKVEEHWAAILAAEKLKSSTHTPENKKLTNYEKYIKGHEASFGTGIIGVSKNHGTPGACGDMSCSNCLFNGLYNCQVGFAKWCAEDAE